jgi:hypothetical protein
MVEQLAVGAQAASEEKDLRVEGPLVHIAVKISQVGVITHRLEERLPTQTVAQHTDQGGLADPDVPRHSYEFFHCRSSSS